MPQYRLREFLEFQVEVLEHAVQRIAPGGDLRPMLVYVEPNGEVRGVLLSLEDKDGEIAAARTLLREMRAVMYATVIAGWTVVLDKSDPAEAERLLALADQHGTGHPELQPMRREIYTVTAGDKDGTLIANFDVERDAEGRIVKLIRQPDGGPHMIMIGRMFDLLAEARH